MALSQYSGLLTVTMLLSGLAFIIGVGFLLAVVFVEPIVLDKVYKKWYDGRKAKCSEERAQKKSRYKDDVASMDRIVEEEDSRR
jgi:hypothetical protein